MVSTGPYSKILKESKRERKKKFQQSTLHAFSKKKARSSTRGFIMEVKSLHYATVKNDKQRGLAVVLTKTFSLCFEHIRINV
jgi:predicted short-subunit dehydrogenase-like oxidoreductase (DUF2520 family)